MTIIERIVAKYLSRDPERARRVIRAAKLKNVRVALKHKEGRKKNHEG